MEEKKKGQGQGQVEEVLSVQTEEHRQRLRTFVAVLPSYTQTTGRLTRCDDDGFEGFCCLGVATEQAMLAGLPIRKQHSHAPGLGGRINYISDGPPYQESSTSLLDVVADFYGFYIQRGHLRLHVSDPILRCPPGVPWHVAPSDAVTLNDTWKLNFEQIAQAFEYTYLRDDWDAKHPRAVVEDDDAPAG